MSNNSINSSTFTEIELSVIAIVLYLLISPIHGVTKVTDPILKMFKIKSATSLLLFTGVLFGIIYYYSIELVIHPFYKKLKTSPFKVGGSLGTNIGGSPESWTSTGSMTRNEDYASITDSDAITDYASIKDSGAITNMTRGAKNELAYPAAWKSRSQYGRDSKHGPGSKHGRGGNSYGPPDHKENGL